MSSIHTLTACFSGPRHSSRKPKPKPSEGQKHTSKKTTTVFRQTASPAPEKPSHVPNCFITSDPAAPKCPSCEEAYNRRRQTLFG